MTDRNDTQTVARTPVATQSASRMKFQGIIEADAEDHPPRPPPAMPPKMIPPQLIAISPWSPFPLARVIEIGML